MPELRVLEFVRHPEGVWDLPRAQVAALERRFPSVRFLCPADRDEAEGLLPEADVVLGWVVKPGNLASARRLRWIHLTAAGVGSALFPGLARSPVVLTNSRGLYAPAMAEHAIGMMLALARNLHLSRDAQLARRWTQTEQCRVTPPLRLLAGSTVGIVGFGAVGAAVAERARALGARVLAVRRRPSVPTAPADEQWGPEGLHRLLESSDWVVLSAALTAETSGLVGRREIDRMRPGAVLVNLGRGALVDEAALVEALREGRIAGAALDVFEDEPLPAGSPLWEQPNALLTPHVSGIAPGLWERAADLFAENLSRFLEGRDLLNVVDKSLGY